MGNAKDGMKPSTWNPPSDKRVPHTGAGTYTRKSGQPGKPVSGIRGGGR